VSDLDPTGELKRLTAEALERLSREPPSPPHPPMTPHQLERARRNAARKKVHVALRNGTLVRGECERAGDGCKGHIEAHHDDYAKPLDVRWLCRGHHTRLYNEARR
jgi:hypothetical protein